MDKDLMLLNDNECDNLIGVFLAKGFEDEEYISPVEAMYGIGIESAFVDDGFFAGLKRGVRNLTTFRLSSKISNRISDIKRLSVNNITQGDTRGVTIDINTFNLFSKVVSNRQANIEKTKEKVQTILSKLEEGKNDSEITNIFDSAWDASTKKASIYYGIVASLKGYISYKLLGHTITSMWTLNTFGLLYAAAFIPMACSTLANVYRFTRSIYYRLKSKTKDSLTPAEQKALNLVNEVANLTVEAVKSIIGINLNATNIEKELENAAKRDGISELSNALSNKAKTVSYDDKVKIVQDLQKFAENEADLKAALDSSNLKKALSDTITQDKLLSKIDVSIGEASLTAKNAKSLVAYATKVSEIAYKCLDAILDDCKKY